MNQGGVGGGSPLRGGRRRPGAVGKSGRMAGLPSADRSNKATLLLTGPVRAAKSSARDLTPPAAKLRSAADPAAPLPAAGRGRPIGREAVRPIRARLSLAGGVGAFRHGF